MEQIPFDLQVSKVTQNVIRKLPANQTINYN